MNAYIGYKIIHLTSKIFIVIIHLFGGIITEVNRFLHVDITNSEIVAYETIMIVNSA